MNVIQLFLSFMIFVAPVTLSLQLFTNADIFIRDLLKYNSHSIKFTTFQFYDSVILNAGKESCYHHHYLILEHFCHLPLPPKIKPVRTHQPLLRALGNCSSTFSLHGFAYYGHYEQMGIIQNVAFCAWFLLLSIFSGFIHVVAYTFEI